MPLPPLRSRITRLFRIARTALPHLILAAALTALLVRLTVTDRIPIIAAIYYASPIILIAIGFALPIPFYLLRKHRVLPVTLLIAAALCIYWHFQHTTRHEPTGTTSPIPQSPPNALNLRVLQWNTARGYFDWNLAVETIRDINPDIAFINEAGPWGHNTPETENPITYWQSQFPDHHVLSTGVRSVILSKFPARLQGLVLVGNGSHLVRAWIETPQGQIYAILADLNANPFRPRSTPFSKIISRINAMHKRRPNLPIILAGDFNTPHDSHWLYKLCNETNLSNAFDQAGTGSQTTWPSPAPILAIDHILVSPHFTIHSAQTLPTTLSDHRPLLTEITLNPLPDAAPQ